MTTVAAGRGLRMIVGVVPATLTVIFAGVIALLALGLGAERRQYALDLADCFVDLAAVLVGSSRGVSGDDAPAGGSRLGADARCYSRSRTTLGGS